MNKPKKLTKPNKLFENSSDWILNKNLGHWYCELDFLEPVFGNRKARVYIWEEDLTKPIDGKLSKSDVQEEKIVWDGFCEGVSGGPDYSLTQEPILNWIRNAIRKKNLI